jgi:hypothetical protein
MLAQVIFTSLFISGSALAAPPTHSKAGGMPECQSTIQEVEAELDAANAELDEAYEELERVQALLDAGNGGGPERNQFVDDKTLSQSLDFFLRSFPPASEVLSTDSSTLNSDVVPAVSGILRRFQAQDGTAVTTWGFIFEDDEEYKKVYDAVKGQ